MSTRNLIQAGLIALLVISLSMIISVGCGFNQFEPAADPVIEEEEAETNGEQEEVGSLPGASGQDQDAPEDNAAGDETTGKSQSPPGDESAQEAEEIKVISDGDYLLVLVTKETTLKSDYAPSDLQSIPADMNPSYSMQLRKEALEHLTELWYTAEADGVTLSIRSAYRSYSTQRSLFQNYADRHGEEEANRFSARPGQSEHQLGTAVDFGGTGVDFKAGFAQTPQGEWLAENAHKFGFALSYPQDKEYITGYIFEPWHYRYIGVDDAMEWKVSGKTLREYLESKPQDYE